MTCAVDSAPLTAGADFHWQRWPAPAGVLVQLRHTLTRPAVVEIGVSA